MCFNSVNTRHVTLRASGVLRWTHYMLRCTRMLYFGDQTPRYIARFCCSSVNTLHATLRASVDFCEHTSCYVARVCCTSVNTLHVTLCACALIRWTLFMLRWPLFFVNSVNTLHVTLCTSFELRWTHFIFRCARMLHFGEHMHVTLRAYVLTWWTHFMLRCTLLLRGRASCCAARMCFNSVNDGERTSCYAARFWCTSVNALHVTLRACV